MEKDSTEQTENHLSLEEKAFLLNTIWEALLTPQWTKDDLIDFGKAIFSKQKLNKMNSATFSKVFPFLQSVSNTVGEKLSKRAQELELVESQEVETKEQEKNEAKKEEEKKEEKVAVETP